MGDHLLMRRRLGLQALTGVYAAGILLGVAGTALLLYSERFTLSVLRTDPEYFVLADTTSTACPTRCGALLSRSSVW